MSAHDSKPAFVDVKAFNLIPSGPARVVTVGPAGIFEYDIDEASGDDARVLDHVVDALIRTRWRADVERMLVSPGVWSAYEAARDAHDKILHAIDVLISEAPAASGLSLLERRLPPGVTEEYLVNLERRAEAAREVLSDAYSPIADQISASLLRLQARSSNAEIA
jgi:hypothetical protein